MTSEENSVIEEKVVQKTEVQASDTSDIDTVAPKKRRGRPRKVVPAEAASSEVSKPVEHGSDESLSAAKPRTRSRKIATAPPKVSEEKLDTQTAPPTEAATSEPNENDVPHRRILFRSNHFFNPG